MPDRDDMIGSKNTLTLMLTIMLTKKYMFSVSVSFRIVERQAHQNMKEEPTMKKLLALALSLCLLLGVVSFASAAEPTTLTMWTFIAQHQDFF